MFVKKLKKHSGAIVWILSGLALFIYGTLGVLGKDIPGVEELVNFVNSAQGGYLYLAAFISIFLEGLYFIGSFFPGSSLVILIAIVAQAGGPIKFLGIIGTVYVGWLLVGLVNVFGAKLLLKHLNKLPESKLEDDLGMTWFPAFRANAEVAQATEGHPKSHILMSSFRVKTIACLGAAVYALVIPFFVDIQELKNEEGFLGLSVIAAISIGTGIFKIYEKNKTAD